MPLPTPPFPSRKTVLTAADLLRALGHSSFDRFVLELGLSDSDIGQRGNLVDRSNSLAKYALANPEALTADGQPLAATLVAKAGEIYRSNSRNNINDQEREAFQKAAAADGILGDVTNPSWPPDFDAPAQEDDAFSILSTFRAIEPDPPTPNSKVFIVHGHDSGMRDTVARFIAAIGLQPIILAEQANGGRTIIEKFERNADVGYAIILLSPDDQTITSQGRARQNVILEWGYFIGRLGRSHVCALKKGDVELPSDILGIVWQAFDEHGAWKQSLAKQLNEAGFKLDASKVLYS